MSLQHLQFDKIVEADLTRLVNDGIVESKAIEYKEALVFVTDDQKRELLSDITALANTDGGDLVLGMRADKGVAIELVGLRSLVPDEAIGKIENLLRDFVQPRLSGVQIRALHLASGNHALLVRAPRSFSSPHMVRHQGVTRFCGRNSNGKYDLDVHELRSAFLASETMADRLKNFRIDRINKLASGTTPVTLTSQHLLVLHIMPVVSARPDVKVSAAELRKLSGESLPRPIGSRGWGSTFNLDGLLVTSSWGDKSHHGFVQLYRNGFLESVESQLLNPRHEVGNGERIIPSVAWEHHTMDAFPSYLAALIALGFSPPYVASISILNVRGFMMYVDQHFCASGSHPVDRDHLLTDEIMIESTAQKPHEVLRPLFDQVWNACGWSGSVNYDENGAWMARR